MTSISTHFTRDLCFITKLKALNNLQRKLSFFARLSDLLGSKEEVSASSCDTVCLKDFFLKKNREREQKRSIDQFCAHFKFPHKSLFSHFSDIIINSITSKFTFFQFISIFSLKKYSYARNFSRGHFAHFEHDSTALCFAIAPPNIDLTALVFGHNSRHKMNTKTN